MKCPKCGFRIWKKEDICPKCGESLANTAAAEEPKKVGLGLLPKLKKDAEAHDSGEKDKNSAEKKFSLEKDKEKEKKQDKDTSRDHAKSSRGAEKTEERAEKDKKKLFGRKRSKVINVKTDEDKAPVETVINLKLILIAAAVLVLVILIIVIVLSLHSSKGERYAEKAYDFIGRNIRDLNDEMTGEIFYADSSQYAGVNNALKFDYIAESEGSVRAGGVKYPKWAVMLKNDKNGGHISDIIYTDFTVIKGDMRGTKTDGLINLDKFSEGEKKSSVMREIKPRPYSISYSQTGIILYTYKYWYKLDSGDEQAAILRVGFSEKGDFKYATTELLIPQYM